MPISNLRKTHFFIHLIFVVNKKSKQAQTFRNKSDSTLVLVLVQLGQTLTFVMHVHALQEVVSDRLHGFQTQTMNIGGRVISSQSGQVDTSDGFQQPGGLHHKTHTRSCQCFIFLICCTACNHNDC